MCKIKPVKRKSRCKDTKNCPPPKKVALAAEEPSSNEEFSDDDIYMKTTRIGNNQPSTFIENRQDILSIKMKLKSSLTDLKNKFSADPNNWANHLIIFQKNFEVIPILFVKI